MPGPYLIQKNVIMAVFEQNSSILMSFWPKDEGIRDEGRRTREEEIRIITIANEILGVELEFMKEDSPIQKKSYAFSLSVVSLYKKLKNKNEFVFATQILKSGTSIGANVEEAVGAQSKKDFFMKITIAYKEARETNYWLRLLKDSDYISNTDAVNLINEVQELLRLLGTIQKTVKRNS